MATSQDFSCCGYDDVEEWEDEFQLVATEDYTSPSFNLPFVLAKCQEAVQPSGVIRGVDIGDTLRSNNWTTLLSVIPRQIIEQGPSFLCSIDGRLPVTHSETFQFILEFGTTLHGLGIGRGHRVALVIPNGVELALGILAVSQWATCVPLSSNSAASELKADLERCGADLVIGPYSSGPLPTRESSIDPAATGRPDDELNEIANKLAVNESSGSGPDWTVHHHVQDIADELQIPFVGLVPSPFNGTFRLWIPPLADGKKTKTRSMLRTQHHMPLDYNTIPIVHGIQLVESNPTGEDEKTRHGPNAGLDEALVLFTSGTTGNKKLVPHCLGDILTAAVTIALSWELNPTDVNCNLMPLFHVGGIIRQVYSPLVSGGAVICCPSFDADLFWALLQRWSFNWYYAAPTMHQIILQTGRSNLGDDEIQSYKLKMIANAAGGLLPSLAYEMQRTFAAAILPSYGMTECMPISSPPATYDLSKPGTSGVPVGPEVAILNTSTMQSLRPREEGPICVRGEPCFRGYGVLANDPSAEKPESFMKDGWFNTGDLGFLDEDGYLYITGRSKEVINRGGEIIPPMEVEEALIGHPDILACAAFAARHDVLQETVGVVIVTHAGKSRSLDLPTLHAYIADKLATPKWPQCLIFMEGGLPKSHTNKLLRVKLGDRLGLPEFSDNMTTWERTFEAQCPPQGASLDTPIPCNAVTVDALVVERSLRKTLSSEKVWVVPHPKRAGALVAHYAEDINPLVLIECAIATLHRYEIPSHVCKVATSQPSTTDLLTFVPTPNQAVPSILNASGDSGCDPIITQVQEIFMNLLDLDYIPQPTDNFFQIGGGSMTASQLASKIRKAFDVGCSGAEVFHHSTCTALGEMIRSRKGDESPGSSRPVGSSEANRDSHFAVFTGDRLPFYNTVAASIVQLIPLFLIFPMWQIARCLLFFEMLMRKSQLFPHLSDRKFTTYVWAYVIFKILWQTFAPLVFVIIKWTVIGRYKAGRYPIWGQYYLRWWIVDVCRKLFLKGIWGWNDTMIRIYYRMLGAKIGDGARIHSECDVAEFDLVHVGEGASVDLCTLRGFAVDNGAMLLGTVSVGEGASVGIKSIVPPSTGVMDGMHLGPGTSAYDATPGACSPKHARVNRMAFKEPNMCSKLFYGAPLTLLVLVAEQIPPMVVTIAMLHFKSRENSSHFYSNWNELMDWLCDPMRIPFFFAIRIARDLFSPFFYMAAALFVKRCFIGRIDPVRTNPNDEHDSARLWLLSNLFRRKKVQAVTDLIGRHYENVSALYRMLGASVGKRVFWPGNQPICDGLFDLLEIGDDVVFGSRSALLCRSVDHCDKIILCAGSNVSDNCIVLPGSVIGRNAVLGSNSITAEGSLLPSGSVWFGNNGAVSQCLDPGDGSDSLEMYQHVNETEVRQPIQKGLHTSPRPIFIASEFVKDNRFRLQGDETTIRPVGKAVYQGKTKGYVFIPVPILVAYAWIFRIFSTAFHTMPIIVAVQFGAVLLYSKDIADTLYQQFFQNHSADNSDCGYEGCKQWSSSGRIFNEDKFFGFQRDFENDGHYHNVFEIYWAVLKCFFVVHFVRVVGWLIIELSAKWLLMGRRKPGRYNYDTSSYAMRWEIYQLTAKIRKLNQLNLLEFIVGTPYMSWYFRANGCKIGKDVCLYPSGADPLMPEPDLVTIGDRCVIDCSSVVCHLNTRGNFVLKPIIIGKECTLRSQSRLQQGIHMEDGSMVLEKTVAMTGEVLDRRSVWQGGPATMWFRYPESSANEYSPPSTDDTTFRSDVEMWPA